MLDKFQPAKADPILGLGKLFQVDPRDGKIDLGVGVYKDASGNTPIVRAVKQAETILHQTQTSKTYVALAGSELFRDEMRKLVLADSVAVDRVATLQTPGHWRHSAGVRNDENAEPERYDLDQQS